MPFIPAPARTDKYGPASKAITKMPTLFLVRGLPGSGRTTLLAGLLQPFANAAVLSADPKGTGGVFSDPLNRAVAQQTAYLDLDRLLEAPGAKSAIGLEGSWPDAGGMRLYVELARRKGLQLALAEPQTIWGRNPSKCARMSTHEPPLPWMKQLSAQWEEVASIAQILAAQSPAERRQACVREIGQMLTAPNPEVAAEIQARLLARYPDEARIHGIGEGLEWKPRPIADPAPFALSSLAPRFSTALVPPPFIRSPGPFNPTLPDQGAGGPSMG